MSRNRDLLTKRNDAIKRDYKNMKSLRKYTSEFIFLELSKKYWITTNTLEAVVFGNYDRPKGIAVVAVAANQISLF